MDNPCKIKGKICALQDFECSLMMLNNSTRQPMCFISTISSLLYAGRYVSFISVFVCLSSYISATRALYIIRCHPKKEGGWLGYHCLCPSPTACVCGFGPRLIQFKVWFIAFLFSYFVCLRCREPRAKHCC